MLTKYSPSKHCKIFWIAQSLCRRFRQQGELASGEWTSGQPLLLEEFGNQEYALQLGADIAILSPSMSSPLHFIDSIRKMNDRLSFIDPFDSIHAMGCIYPDVIQPAIKHIHDLADYPLPPVGQKQFVEIRKYCHDLQMPVGWLRL
jgi:hypothetical protein